MTFKLSQGGRLLSMAVGLGLAWACTVSDKGEYTFDDDPTSGGSGGSSASGGKGGKASAGSAGRSTGGRAGAAGSSGLAGEAGEAGQTNGGQGGEGGQGTSGSSGKGGTGGLPDCDTGQKRCDGACIDVLENNNHCGDCDNECDSTHLCTAGVCELDCRSNEKICNGVCVNTNTDPKHCGDCGIVCDSRQACFMGTCSLDCGALTNCNGACVDLTNSPQYCGDCDTACGGNTECVMSSCGCTGGKTLCQPGGVDTCIDTDTDPDNCGDCDQKCNLPNAASTCVGGSCAVQSCANNTADCNRMPNDGCEVDRDDDVDNCGACNNQCSLANATAGCSGGSCTVASCSGAYRNCNNMANDGCEVNSNTDPSHCGGCNAACSLANATAGCSGGSCTVASCSGAYRNCNNMANDGCEVNSNTDPNHCGACNNQCSLANATAGCSGGSCTVASCTGAFRNCNNMANDGCEVNSNTNPSHCGGCGAACSLANATAGCSGGSCTVASCTGAFRNCNNMANDGCEINTNTDAANCGGCGNACASGISCVGGVCQDPCMSYGGTKAVVNGNIRICNTPTTYGSWTTATFPSGWGACTLNQWAAYAPSSTPASVLGTSSSLWINSNCATGTSCETGGYKPWIFYNYPMNQASCYLGDACNTTVSNPLLLAVCTGAGYSTACNSIHREFTDGTRLNSYTGTTVNYCDNTQIGAPDWFGAGWYRYYSSAGTRMAGPTPAIDACGTDATGYLTGTFPTTANGLVTRTVCYNWGSSTCNWMNDIQMVNCGAYSLYNLPITPACHLRYCGAP